MVAGHAFASTAMLLSSSNMTSNPNVCLGLLTSVRKRQDAGKRIERKHFVGPLRYLNNMGALTVVDVLGRDEVTEVVDGYLASEAFATLKLGAREKGE